jgi:hypothetical protein
MSRRARVSIGIVAAAIAVALVESQVIAHGVQYPKRHELTLEPGKLRLESKLDVHGHDEGTQLRERFDIDRDGNLDQDEAQQLARHIAVEEHRTLTLLVDGKPVSLTMTALSEDGLVGPVRVTEHQKLAAIWETALASPPRSLRLLDREDEGMRRVLVSVSVRGERIASASGWKVACDPASGASLIEEASVTGDTPLELSLVPGEACAMTGGK